MMKNCKINVSVEEDDEVYNAEVFIDGESVTVEDVIRLIDKLDNHYDANGLTDIMNDSYDDGTKMVWKIEMFFEVEPVNEIFKSTDALSKDIETFIKGIC